MDNLFIVPMNFNIINAVIQLLISGKLLKLPRNRIIIILLLIPLCYNLTILNEINDMA